MSHFPSLFGFGRSATYTALIATAALFAATNPARAQPPAQPAPQQPGQPPAQASEPAAPGGSETEPIPPDAAEVRKRLDQALAAQPGGLRAKDVAQRADTSSPEIRAKQQAVEAAAAKVDEAVALYIPQVKLLGRYARLSKMDAMNLGGGGGSIVGTNVPPGQPIPIECFGPSLSDCFVRATGVQLSFPAILDIWTLQGTLGIPISDYFLRIPQNHASAKQTKKAAEVQMAAARSKVQTDAKVAYYNWLRAQGGVIVAEQGLATAMAHLKDVRIAEQVGVASRADLMAVESHVASTELLVEKSKNMTALVHEQLRVMMHDPENVQYTIGEDTTIGVATEKTNLKALYEEALRERLERKVITETVSSLREARKALVATNYPRLDAFGNLYYQNPNTRAFPQEKKWKASWDVGVQLSWTMNDVFSTRAKTAELDAKLMEIEAQQAQLDDGIRMQVTQAFNALRDAETAKKTTEKQIASAEESYRVRRELFRAGRATSSELTEAETALLKAGFDLLNARIDIRIARENLDQALGRNRLTR